MSFNHAAAGQALRRLRQRYSITLQEAAARMTISPSLLSRKERGDEETRREDIRSAISAYNLSPREAARLWLAAGFLPEHSPAPPDTGHLCNYAAHMLTHLALPAMLLDRFWYIRAWTHDIEAIWSLSQAASTDIHLVDSLFSGIVQEQSGQGWHAYAVYMLRLFYQETLPVASMPAFRDLLHTLRIRHGEAFVEAWNQAHSEHRAGSLPAASGAVVLMQHQHAHGSITCAVATAVLASPSPYQIITYIPYDPQNLERYWHFRAALGPEQLHYRL